MAKLIRESESRDVPPPGYLFVEERYYQVLEWTDAHLAARATPRAADIELRVDFADSSVERTSRETSARGAEVGGSSATLLWVLR
jgi:hypothetical protein